LPLCSRKKSKFGEPHFLLCLLFWDFLSTLKMEVICFSETSDVSELRGVTTHIHRRENLKPNILCSSTFEINCPRMIEIRFRRYTVHPVPTEDGLIHILSVSTCLQHVLCAFVGYFMMSSVFQLIQLRMIRRLKNSRALVRQRTIPTE
jgi:hypothetical protein